MVEHREIRLVVTLTAAKWEPSRDGARTWERRWDGPPIEPSEEGEEQAQEEPNVAARVEQTGKFWPFKKWAWTVFSPFGDEAVLEGTAASPTEAMTAADDALLRLCAQISQSS